MCRIYAGIEPRECEAITRSVRLSGHVTSIRLERQFWTIVDDMAAAQGKSTPCFLSVLYNEILDLQGEVRNFASHLRVACTIFCSRRTAEEDLHPHALAAE
jgi:predicted DNA-binding ribbon-helix-helix protein